MYTVLCVTVNFFPSTNTSAGNCIVHWLFNLFMPTFRIATGATPYRYSLLMVQYCNGVFNLQDWTRTVMSDNLRCR